MTHYLLLAVVVAILLAMGVLVSLEVSPRDSVPIYVLYLVSALVVCAALIYLAWRIGR